MAACVICGGVTPLPKPRGQAPKYCGDACRLVGRGLARQSLRETQPDIVRERNRIKQAKWRASNPENFRTYRKKHYAANKRRILDLRRNARNPEKERERSRKRYAANPEKWRKWGKRWQQANLHRYRIYGNTRRARKNAVFVEVVDPRVVFDRDKGICGICLTAVDPASAWEVDHVMPISKGGAHSYANVQLSHRRCNRVKHARILNHSL